MSTRIDGPRSQRVRFSTGRAAELRAVPNFRAMHRAGVLDKHDLADLQSVIRGELDPSLLDPRVEEAILRHVFVDPRLSDLAVLDESEIAEAIAFSIRSYLDAQSAQLAQAMPEDEESFVDEDLDAKEAELPPAASEEELLALAEDALPTPGDLPESPELGAQ